MDIDNGPTCNRLHRAALAVSCVRVDDQLTRSLTRKKDSHAGGMLYKLLLLGLE
jgi:hypothetical protein